MKKGTFELNNGDAANVMIKGNLWNIYCDKNDPYLKESSSDGYCCYTSKSIVVGDWDTETKYEDILEYKRKVVRHEIIHAFMFESGLSENISENRNNGHDEMMVDWIAMQYHDIKECFESLGL